MINNIDKELSRFIIEKTPDVITVVSRDASIQFISRTVADLTLEGMRGRKLFEFINTEFQGRFKKKLIQVFKTGHSANIIIKRNVPKGSSNWYHLHLEPYLKEGEVLNVILFGRDITEQMQIDVALKESEEKFRIFAETTHVGIVLVQDDKIKYANEAMSKINEFSVEEMMSWTASQYLQVTHPEDIPAVIERLKRRQSGDKSLPESFTCRLITKSGKIKWIESYGKTIHYKGKFANFGSVIDITEKKEADKRKQFFVDQMLKASKFKTEFMATMSHELRTPLNIIVGFTDLLLEGLYGNLNKEQEEFTKDIKNSAEHLSNLIDRVIDISKIETGNIELNVKKFHLKPISTEIFSTFMPLLKKKNLEFQVLGINDDDYIIADPIRFKQIIYNLVSNAIKYTERGKIEFEFVNRQDEWRFNVIDTGIGIAKEYFSLIFREFQRVNTSEVNSVQGTGLGLPLSKRLVNLHGGELFFESEVGKGSVFSFTIPKIIYNVS